MLVALPFASVQICVAAEPTAPLEPVYAYHGAEPADLSAPVKTETAVAEPTAILPFLGDEARKRGYVLAAAVRRQHELYGYAAEY